MGYEIEFGVPQPAKRVRKKRFDFSLLPIGASVFIPHGAINRRTPYEQARRGGFSIRVAYETKDGIEGFRVWRTA